ncbi:MAG: hypothetical protein M1821_009462 [Bathelium mastoideum]|nr:MAG: hypothetical protein M1821_009462 [Bathelium mastoideum]
MVLDPFSALGLASNIIQFVDFGSKIISRSIEQYQSVLGTNAQHVHLESITVSLRSIAKGLSESSAADQQAKKHGEDSLRLLAIRCRETADQLLAEIEKLKVDPRLSGTSRKFASLWQAFASLKEENRLAKFEQTLEQYRSQLTMHLVALVRDQNSSLQLELRELQRLIRETDTSRADQLAQLQNDIGIIKKDAQQPFTLGELSTLQSRLSTVAVTGRYLSRESKLLDSLRFNSMTVRDSDIKEPHEATFRWVLDPQSLPPGDHRHCVKFVKWLEARNPKNGIYYVAGKAGSGKSTLMKYLSNDPRTVEALGNWAMDRKLVVARFFFWHAGTTLQKSQEGLLRALLFEVLRHCPAIIKDVFPDPWERTHVPNTYEWTRHELLQALLKVARQETEAVMFCFFIDGLDEYAGDHAELVDVIREMAAMPNIKICVASRPWEVFKEAFDQDSERRLYLQDVTKQDIEAYVLRMLEANASYRKEIQAQKSAEWYTSLVSQITEKAQGVFLWVFLVVRSLLEGLENGDPISILRKRLEELPGDLKKLFQRILDDIPRVYKETTARNFQVALTAVEPLQAMAYAQMDDDSPPNDSGSLTTPYSAAEIFRVVEKTSKQLNTSTKGLLECSPNVKLGGPAQTQYYGIFVDFLHRTVRDFLYENRDSIQEIAGSQLQVHKTICHALLQILQRNPFDRRDDLEMKRQIVRKIMFHARHTELLSGSPQVTLLDQTREMMPVELSDRDDFLGHCAAMGLCLYVENKIKRFGLQTPKDSRPLLHFALMPGFWASNLPTPDKNNNDMVTLLLEHGADPNEDYSGITVWSEYLIRLQKDIKKVGANRAVEIALCLKHKADPNVKDDGCALWGTFLEFPTALGDENSLVAVLESFVSHGADPNLPVKTFLNLTIWERFIEDLCDRRDSPRLPYDYDITEMLIRAGASLDVAPVSSLHDIVLACFPSLEAARLQHIIDEERTKRQKRKRFRFHRVFKFGSGKHRGLESPIPLPFAASKNFKAPPPANESRNLQP